MVLLAALSGCVSSDCGAGGGGSQYMSHAFDHGSGTGCMSGVPAAPRRCRASKDRTASP